jgi:hypothetical protein
METASGQVLDRLYQMIAGRNRIFLSGVASCGPSFLEIRDGAYLPVLE